VYSNHTNLRSLLVYKIKEIGFNADEVSSNSDESGRGTGTISIFYKVYYFKKNFYNLKLNSWN